MRVTGAIDSPQSLIWLGQREPCLDQPIVTHCGAVVLGRYGGCRAAGANKNEDGALIWSAADGAWEVAAIIDAHASSESAALVLDAIAAQAAPVAALLAQSVAVALPAVARHFSDLFASDALRAACRRVAGETACLLCVRKDQFVWWLSIGDCIAYVLHPELARIGQFALNQRQFFEWIGRVNTFDLPVPCYTTGVRELRGGHNTLLLATDGLLECGTRPFQEPQALYRIFSVESDATPDLAAQVTALLQRVHRERGRDSATVIAWAYANPHAAAMPSL